jgi:integrase
MAVRAGLRRGELVALRWGDIQTGGDNNDSERFILVQHNYVAVNTRRPKAKNRDGWICPVNSDGYSSSVVTNVCWRLT